MADAYYSSHYELSKTHSDTVNLYNKIFEKYGYNKAQFDTTLRYYAVHTNEFDQVYEEVVTLLSKTEQDIYQNRPIEFDQAQNLWYGKNYWYLPREGNQKKIPVRLKLEGKGKYVITYTYKIFDDDQSKNLRAYLYFAKDTTPKAKIDTVKVMKYTKDARTTVATFTKDLKDSTFRYLQGYLLNHDNKTGKWRKHLIIENLKVYYVPAK
jgi:hypothetical protein